MAMSTLTAKVISLRGARDQVHRMEGSAMNEVAERRIEQRQPREDRLFAQVTSCSEADLVGATFSCHTQDVSTGGLCITTDEFIPEGAKLDLWIENSRRPGKYFLTGDVRWSVTIEGARCAMGLELQASPTTDIETWRRDHH